MNYTFNTFTTKDEYLTAKQQWKDEYATLTSNIRATKRQIKQAMKAGQYAGTLQYERIKQKRLANEMLDALATAKIEAQKQYVLEHETEMA